MKCQYNNRAQSRRHYTADNTNTNHKAVSSPAQQSMPLHTQSKRRRPSVPVDLQPYSKSFPRKHYFSSHRYNQTVLEYIQSHVTPAIRLIGTILTTAYKEQAVATFTFPLINGRLRPYRATVVDSHLTSRSAALVDQPNLRHEAIYI